MQLKRANTYDMTFIGKLRESTNPFLVEQHHYTVRGQRKFWNEKLRTGVYLLWIIREGVHRAGYIQLRNIQEGLFGKKSAEFGIAIKEKYRGKGLGSKAMHLFCRIIKLMDYDRLWLTVKKKNYHAQQLFLNAGFNFVEGEQFEVFKMEKIL